MALASLPTRDAAPFGGLAHRLETGEDGTVVVLDDGRAHAVAARPDPSGAARCRRALNQVLSVSIDGPAHRPVCRVRGIGNRLPVVLTVPLAVALGLAASGVPTLVRLTGTAR